MLVLKYHACIMHASRWSEDTWMHCCIFFAYQFCERSLLSVCWRLKAGRCRDCVSDASVPSHSCGNTHIHSIHCLHSHYSNPRRWRHTRLFLFSGSVNIRRQLWLLRLKFHRTVLLRCYSYPASGHFVRCRQYFDRVLLPGLRRICYLWSQLLILSCRRLSLVVFTFSFFVLVFSWWLILTLHSKCGQLFHPNCALLRRRESSHLFLIPSSLSLHWTNISDITNQLIPIKIGEELEEYIRVQNEPQRTRYTTSADKCKN